MGQLAPPDAIDFNAQVAAGDASPLRDYTIPPAE